MCGGWYIEDVCEDFLLTTNPFSILILFLHPRNTILFNYENIPSSINRRHNDEMKGTERLQKHVITQIDHSKVLLQKMKGCVCVKKRLQHVSQRDTSKVVSLSEICEESPKNANHTDLLFVTGQIITYNKNKSSICQSLRTFNNKKNIILSPIKIHTRVFLRLFVLRCRIFPKTYDQNMIQNIYI